MRPLLLLALCGIVVAQVASEAANADHTPVSQPTLMDYVSSSIKTWTNPPSDSLLGLLTSDGKAQLHVGGFVSNLKMPQVVEKNRGVLAAMGSVATAATAVKHGSYSGLKCCVFLLFLVYFYSRESVKSLHRQ